MPTIINKVEGKRGCGRRKKGGMYMVADWGSGSPCGKLPAPLTVCPHCSCGIKPTKGWTWITTKLFSDITCKSESCDPDSWRCKCPFAQPEMKMGLLWIGGKFYDSPDRYLDEARHMGFSRRIGAVPKDFKVGQTWVALAHREAIMVAGSNGEVDYIPAVFHAFKPQRLEYIVFGNESEEELENLEKRGFTLVNVIPDDADYSDDEFTDEEEL